PDGRGNVDLVDGLLQSCRAQPELLGALGDRVAGVDPTAPYLTRVVTAPVETGVVAGGHPHDRSVVAGLLVEDEEARQPAIRPAVLVRHEDRQARRVSL